MSFNQQINNRVSGKANDDEMKWNWVDLLTQPTKNEIHLRWINLLIELDFDFSSYYDL